MKKQKRLKKKKKPAKPVPVPFLGSKLRPIVQVPKAPPPSIPARRAQASVLPLTSIQPGDPPSGLKQGLSSLNWFLFALGGTGLVFLTAVGSRRLFVRRPSRRTASLTEMLQQAPAPRLTHARNGSSPVAAVNGSHSMTPAERPHPRRRCLIPGCQCEDHTPAEQQASSGRAH